MHRFVARALAGVSIASVVAVVGVGVLTVYEIIDNADERHDACQRAVASRVDLRAMWEYALGENPGPEADAFRLELDNRLPILHCVDNQAIPLE